MDPAILLTNIALHGRSGTEVVTEQLADAFRRRGRRVAVFTPQIGPMGQAMRRRGHLVVERPDALPWRPDLIHGHHTGPTMAALAAHPGVPGLFVCHDATAPFDAVPDHPRLLRVAAVDAFCASRLVAEGTPEARITLLPNAVDLTRLAARPGALPARPRRALALTKHGAHLPVLRAACQAAGLALREIGSGPGEVLDRPEDAAAEADLVFATARGAMEAAAGGAGVILCDARGLGGFMTAAKAAAWLPWNLGAGVLAAPTDLAGVSAAIEAWDPAEAAAAASLVRRERDLETILDRIEALHADLLAAPMPRDPAAEAAAVGRFITGWVPHFDQQAPWRAVAEAVMQPPPGSPLDALAQAVEALRREAGPDRAAAAAASAALAADLAAGRAAAETAARETAGALAATRAEIAAAGQALSALQADGAAARAAIGAVPQALGAEIALLARRTAGLEARIEALAARRGPAERAWDALRGVWRRVVPHAIRAPLHRLRRGG